MPPYSSRTKALSCQKGTHLERKKEASLFSLPPPLLHDPIFLLCWLWQREGDFYFGFLCWRSKFPGMWNQRRRCHVSPPSFFNPSQQSLWDSQQRISSSMRNGSELHGGAACRGLCRHAIPRMMRRQVASISESTCAAADDFTRMLGCCSTLTVIVCC